MNLLIRYTDALAKELRWTCMIYVRSELKSPKRWSRWSVSDLVYAERELSEDERFQD